MSFDREALTQAIDAHGPVVRIVVAQVAGSTPRDLGTSMLVWADGQSGTIGGGSLEHEATKAARAMLEQNQSRLYQRIPLGPARGQCCGGAVSLFCERFDAQGAKDLAADIIARGTGPEGPAPLSVQRILARARNGAQPILAQFVDGWMIEPVRAPAIPVWIWGAGHVGRALVSVMSPLPELSLTWIDTGPERFPDKAVREVTLVSAQKPAELVRYAPPEAQHLIVTYSHALDLELCHQLLRHGFDFAGLIGSATKWARFRARLRDLGHTDAHISRICCPIGQPELGKHPQAIAVGVASALLMRQEPQKTTGDVPGDRAFET